VVTTLKRSDCSHIIERYLLDHESSKPYVIADQRSTLHGGNQPAYNEGDELHVETSQHMYLSYIVETV
jgi:hypothetical protein